MSLKSYKRSALVLYDGPQVPEGGLGLAGGPRNIQPPPNTGEVEEDVLYEAIAAGSRPVQRHCLRKREGGGGEKICKGAS